MSTDHGADMRIGAVPNDSEGILQSIRSVLCQEAMAVQRVADGVDESYERAIRLLLGCQGKVVVTGMGKSGLIARKIAATMSSTGTLSVFMHPAEALHGDLGMVSPSDVVIAIGKSGESDEIVGIIPVLKRIGTPVIAITANPSSTMARHADVILLARVEREACPFDLVPTTSTTVALAIGDALAMTLMGLKQFQPEDFALYHPGGRLGRQLLLRVCDLMVPLERCPVLDSATATIEEVIIGLTKHGLGVVLFSNDSGHLSGIITDGDIRRLLGLHRSQVFGVAVAEVMNTHPITYSHDALAVDALRFMEARERPLNVLPVLSEGALSGVLRLHDLVRVA